MNDKLKYFKILGIQPTEDLNIIKKAYRRSALKYHPDRNPNKEAHIKFIEITLAYDILIGQVKFEEKLDRTKVRSTEEIIAEKIRLAKERYRYQTELEKRKDELYYKKVASGWKWRYFNLAAFYTLLFTVLLTIDFFSDSEHISYSHNRHDVYHLVINRTLMVENEKFSIEDKDFWFNENGFPPMYGNYSYLFHDLKSIHYLKDYIPNKKGTHSDIMRQFELFDKYEQKSIISHSSIYWLFPFLHIILLIPVILLIFKRPTLRFNIWRMLTIWFIYPLIVILTFSNDRIYHLFGAY